MESNCTVIAEMGFPSALVFVSLLSLALPQASSKQINSNVTLAGIVACSNASIASVKAYPAIPEARVDVVCGILLLEKVIKSTTTNLAGVYSFSFSAADMVMLTVPELCYLNVTLPANICVFHPSGGFLKFPIIAMRSALGMVHGFIPGAPRYLHV